MHPTTPVPPAGTDDCVLIPGFALAGYRSFGPEIQRVGPCAKVNLFIGQNNSGKSNLLRFIQDHHATALEGGGNLRAFKDLEQHRASSPVTVGFGVLVRVGEAARDDIRKQLLSQGHWQVDQVLDTLLASTAFERAGEGFWLELEAGPTSSNAEFPARIVDALMQQVGRDRLFYHASLALANSASPDDERANIQNVLRSFWNRLRAPKPIGGYKTIPAVRRPGTAATKDAQSASFSGEEIIHGLARLQDPPHHAQHLRRDFERVERFFQEVTDRPDARLQVPYDRDTITVHMDGRSLPLEALGTGIHQVIILAAAATALHRHVVCIEEPEANLHPLLQKKLLRYLEENTDNQYFIATHSAHLLDHPGAAVFHVRLTETGSKVTVATDPAQRFSICTDLGYRASDLLQSNCVIWVEGPSDRLYLREWIRLHDPTLAEGIDYSLMFYGGRLLSHLSADDPEVEEFISLRRLNRNLVVVMDGDRHRAGAPINATKQRIVREWKDQPGFAWITQGREIENYVTPAAMLEALQAVAPKGKHKAPSTAYDQAIAVSKAGVPAASKVKVAHWLVNNGKLDLDRLDLHRQVERLCEFIHQANHVPTAVAVVNGTALAARRSRPGRRR